jgi:lipopolysaccharide/colanic/teichoic acid biosynthesis glycosyltransferase
MFPRRRRRTVAALRRFVDVCVAGLLLALLVGLFAAVTVIVRASSRGPAIFRQQRVGKDGRLFTLYKFRTMRREADDSSHRAYVSRLITEDAPPAGGARGLYKLQDDPRLTPVGGFLRRTSLDELPQLMNVLRGDMALVGPRPVLPWEAALFDPRYQARFSVRPGITGLWQVSGRAQLTMREALDLDIAYVEQQRLGLDLRILLKTVPVVLFRHATW